MCYNLDDIQIGLPRRQQKACKAHLVLTVESILTLNSPNTTVKTWQVVPEQKPSLFMYPKDLLSLHWTHRQKDEISINVLQHSGLLCCG